MKTSQIDIICTIGPSCWELNTLKQMVKNGMTIMRLNGAFADDSQLNLLQSRFEVICSELGLEPYVDLKLMMDIKGVEIRLNNFHGSYIVNVGDVFEIGSSIEDEIYPATYLELYKDLKVGTVLKVDKGKVELEVIEISNGKIVCKVNNGGEIIGGKGIIAVDTLLSNSPLTAMDLYQIEFAIKNTWNYLALSMISSVNQLDEINHNIESINNRTNIKLISKIETLHGVNNLGEIYKKCDGIMIGRGDLSVDVGFEKIPEIQNTIQAYCKENSIYHIVATELLESMRDNDLPSCADITDITHALKNGCNALMLSGETSLGKYPAECVKVLYKLVNYNL